MEKYLNSLSYIYKDIEELIINDDAYALDSLFSEYKILIDYRNNDDQTWLHIASQYGTWGCMEILLSYGLNINATDLVGDTPLHKALAKKHSSAVEWLLMNEADPNIKNVYGASPVLYAAYWSQEILKMIISYGGDKRARDNHGDGIRKWSNRGIHKAQQILCLYEKDANFV